MHKLLFVILIISTFSANAAETGREYIDRLVYEGMTPYQALAKAYNEGSEDVSLEEYAPSCTDKFDIFVDSNLRSTEFVTKDNLGSLGYIYNDQISCRLISKLDKSNFVLWLGGENMAGTNLLRYINGLDRGGYHLQSVDTKSKSLRLISSYPMQTVRVMTVRRFRELFITQQVDKERGSCQCESENGRVVLKGYRMTWKENRDNSNNL